jgi:hypothetical protein
MERLFSRCAALAGLILGGCGSETPPEPTELRQALPVGCSSIDRTSMTDHSCTHADFGPFVSVNASARRDFAAASPNVNSVHTHYTITLPGSPGANEGTVKYRPQRSGEWAMYVAPTTSLTLLDSTGNAVPLVIQQSIGSCALLNHAYVFNLTALATYRLVLGPSAGTTAAVVIERLDDFQTFYFADADGDGFGDSEDVVTTMCEAPVGRVTDDTDCDDGDAAVNATASELCDGTDNDCDGQTDEDAATVSYLDADGDGHGDAGQVSTACPAPAGYVVTADDCDDSDPESHPGAEEICDGADNDCNGDADEGLSSSPTTCGVGACLSTGTLSCTSGAMTDSCSPATPAANDASCNAVDDDCDGQVDDDFVGSATTCGVGSCQQTGATSCVGGTVIDSCSAASSGTEVCDGADNDCDGQVDEGVLNACGMCGVVPGEVCDGIDNDCNGAIDDVDGGCGGESCGNGAIDYDDREECDDGNAEAGDGCDECKLECADVTQEATSHTCFHVQYGPFESHPAQTYPGFIFTDISATHTHFALGLPPGSDSTPAAVSYHPVLSGPFAFYSDSDEPMSVVRASDGATVPMRFERSVSSSSCGEGLAWVRVYELDETEIYHVVLGPTQRTEMVVVAEYLPSFGQSYFMRDSDGDGWGDDDSAVNVWCELENNPYIHGDRGGDCDAESPSVNPGAIEVCNDIDDNCLGGVDDVVTGYRDADGDGYGDWNDSVSGCTVPEGYVPNDDATFDCNDTNTKVHTGAPELCDEIDNDCDNEFDEDPSCGGGCVPTPEVCDGLDNDCNGVADESGGTTYYADADGDGYGDASLPVLGCSPLPGYVASAGDCNDGDPGVHPQAEEACDEIDNDCDGDVDNLEDPIAHAVEHSCHHAELGPFVGVQPALSDTTPLPNVSAPHTAHVVLLSNSLPGTVTYTPTATGDFAILLGADVPFTIEDSSGAEVELEANEPVTTCGALARLKLAELEAGTTYRFVFGSVATPSVLLIVEALGGHEHGGGHDEEAVGAEFFRDADGDGHGTSGVSLLACYAPDGYVTTSDDCDDSNAATYEGATESCDGLDNNCDGEIDEEGALDPRTFYRDADGDGYGNGSLVEVDCDAPDGFVAAGGDCNDAAPAVHPGAEELCNGQDDDCDGEADSGSLRFYRDRDRDGYGNEKAATQACEAPPGYSPSPGDCNDRNASVHPAAVESCDGKDDDCDGKVDDGGVCKCPPLKLHAMCSSRPSWGGTLRLGRSTRVAVPASLRVARGNAGAGEATLEIRWSGRKRDIECRYRAAPGGKKYVLKSCSNGLRAGDPLDAVRVTLRADGCSRGFGTARVVAELDNLSCRSRKWGWR